jgi:hypothetical protein
MRNNRSLNLTITLILLTGIVSSLQVGFLTNVGVAYAQNATGNSSLSKGAVERTNLDIPSIDFTLSDGSSVSPDFRSIYFNEGGKGQTIYAYYNDYGLPENKPQVKEGDQFSVDIYPAHSDTPKPSDIQISISKVMSGDETGNFTEMKLGNGNNLSSNGNSYTIPNVPAGNYILDTFVNYPIGGIVLVYTIEVQINS